MLLPNISLAKNAIIYSASDFSMQIMECYL